MEVDIKKNEHGYSKMVVRTLGFKYPLIGIVSFMLINRLWMMWEISVYGEIKPDKFDGLVLFLFCISIGVNFFQKDCIKALTDAFPINGEYSGKP